jgi:hypothetical protein
MMLKRIIITRFRMFLLFSLGLIILATGGTALAGAPIKTRPDIISSPPGQVAPLSPFPGPDGQGYYVQVVPYAWIEIAASGIHLDESDWKAISGSSPLDDGYAGPLPIGFSFPFYDETWTELYLSTNGFISFGLPSVSLNNQCALPDILEPNKIIALMWDDLDLSYAGSVYYQPYKTCPGSGSACLVVEFVAMTHWAWLQQEVLGSAGTWQAILYPDGTIIVQFKDPGIERGLESTTGIEGKNADQDSGLTYACNTADSLYAGLAVRFARVPGLYLKPQPLVVSTCPNGSTFSQIELVNNTALTSTCVLSYSSSLSLTVSGPEQVTLGPFMTTSLPISLTPLNCPFDSDIITASVSASNGELTAQTDINAEVAIEQAKWVTLTPEPDGRQDAVVVTWEGEIWSIAGDTTANEVPVLVYNPAKDTWRVVPNSEPPFSYSRPRSGILVGDKVFLYGDAFVHTDASFNGLWSYNLRTNTWQQESPSGTPPPFQGIAYPAWVRDPSTGFLYLTGGSLSWSDAGTLDTVFVYDPAENRWLTPLPKMTTARNLHAAFMHRDTASGHRMMCVLGGLSLESMYLSSTQCYDLDEGAWHQENADIGALPFTIWGMAWVERSSPDGMQWWLVGGQQNGAFSSSAWYFNPSKGTWHNAGFSSLALNRSGAATLGSDLFKVGGYLPSNEPVGILDRYRAVPCERCRYTLQVTVDGLGTVNPYPPWPGFLAGEMVRLSALPGWGAHWQGWSGDISGTDNPLTITINGDTWLTATFSARYYYVPLLLVH